MEPTTRSLACTNGCNFQKSAGSPAVGPLQQPDGDLVAVANCHAASYLEIMNAISRSCFMTGFQDQPTQRVAPPIVYVTEKTRWEYKQVVRSLSENKFPSEEELNRLGKDGWELVTILNSSGFLYLYFKRPKD